MLLKILFLIIALAIIKQVVFAYTRAERRRYKPKYRPKDPTDTMNYQHVKPVTATIGGKTYTFSSKAEYRYALSLQDQIKKGIIAAWSYEDTLFAFYPHTYNKAPWKPDGVSVVMHPKGGMSVPDTAKVKAYLPDFCIAHTDGSIEYVEIKGRMTPRAQTALQNMKKFYPSVNLTVLYV